MMFIAPDYQTPQRMALKRQAVPLPDLMGKRVLDLGCDAGFWSFEADRQGALDVLGLDRNRDVRGRGVVDLVAENRRRAMHEGRSACRFERINVGKQWKEFGRFDLVLALSVYHHIYENCGDHAPIWFWLWRHCASDGEVLWEGPVDDSDPVVRANVSDVNRSAYVRAEILEAAQLYFYAEHIGPALHEPTREVWRFRPKSIHLMASAATMRDGAGGAAAAFRYAGERRMAEIEAALGIRPIAGSLNLQCAYSMDWERGYYRAQLLDVVERGKGLDVEWAPRWARFRPVLLNGVAAFAFRFEGEGYDARFVELIGARKLREAVFAPVMLQC